MVLLNCMSCAFNVMYIYFNSKHASSDKTTHRQHMNNKRHVKAKIVPAKNLNNVKHAKNKGVSPQHVNKDKILKSKTASPPKARMETLVPKPKQKVVKVVYKVKGSVSEKVNVVENKTVYKVKYSISDKTNSVNNDKVVLPYKGQFFKYVGPNQVWVPKKV